MTKAEHQQRSRNARIGKGEIRKVWDAYVAGCRTTGEVSAITGLTVKRCSSYTKMLEYWGRLVKRGRAPRVLEENRRGRHSMWYEPVKASRLRTLYPAGE